MNLHRQLQCFDGDGMQQLVALDELNHMLNSIQQGEVRLSPFVASLVRIVERSPNGQVVLMAVRALVHIFDLEPRCCALAIAEGCVVPVCRQLVSLTDLDLAEQGVKLLKLLCQFHSRDVLGEGGLRAITAFFDFFPQHLQRRAMETLALICIECSRQVDDGVQVLLALPNLIKLANAANRNADEQFKSQLALMFSRIVSSFSMTKEPTKRHSQPPHAILKVLHQWNALPRRNAELDYFALELDLFAATPPAHEKWRQVVLAEVAKQPQILAVLAQQQDFAALGKLCQTSPHVVLPRLRLYLGGWNFKQALFADVTALRLVQCMLPFPPNSLQFEHMKGNRAEFDSTLECASMEEIILEEDEEDANNGGHQEQHVVLLDEDDENDGGEDGGGLESFVPWACDACTFENEPEATSCDICGKMKAVRSSQQEQRGEAGGDNSNSRSSLHEGAGAALELLTQPVLDTAPSIASVYRQRPYLLPKLFFHGDGEEGVFALLCQVAAKSANPEFRTKSLGALASVVSILPRDLLNQHQHLLEGVVSTNLAQQDDAHIVASALRLALVVLFRVGITQQMAREQVPRLIKDCLVRFPVSSSAEHNKMKNGDRILSLRRRATAWLDHYGKQGLLSSSTSSSPSLSSPSSMEKDVVGSALETIAAKLQRLLPAEQAPPPVKRHRGVESSLAEVLEELRELLRDPGVLPHEFTQSSLADVLAHLLSQTTSSLPALMTELVKVFASKDDLTRLVQLLQDSLVMSDNKGFAVVESALPFRFLLVHDKLVCAPAIRTRECFQRLGLGEGDGSTTEFSFKADSLLDARQLEVVLWNNIKAKLAERGAGGKPSPASLKRRAPVPTSTTTAANEQAGDAVFVPVLRVGQLVTRGRDWKWQDQDGGAGNVGTVLEVKTWNGMASASIKVRWNHTGNSLGQNTYRYTEEEPNSVDLALAPRQRTRPAQPSGKSSSACFDRDEEDGGDEAFREGLVRGVEIDAMDSFHCWYQAVVRVVVKSANHESTATAAVRVSFKGFGPRYDEWIPLTSWRLARSGTRVGSLFAQGEMDDFGREVFARDRGEDDDGAASSSSADDDYRHAAVLREYRDRRSDLVLHPGMEIQFHRLAEGSSTCGEEETAVVLQLKTEKSKPGKGEESDVPESKLDAEVVVEGDREEEGEVPLERVLVQLSKERALSSSSFSEDHRGDGEEEEEEEGDEEDEEFYTEWVKLSTISLVRSPATFPSTTTATRPLSSMDEEEEEVEEDFLQAGARCFAKVAIGNKEVWLAVSVLGRQKKEEDGVMFQLETVWDEAPLEEQRFAVSRQMLQRAPPHGAFAPGLGELRTLVKMFSEFSDRGVGHQHRYGERGGDEGDEEEEELCLEEEEEEENGGEEEENGGEGDLTMMGQTPIGGEEEPAYNASRARTLTRQYPELDLTFSDSRLTTLLGMSAMGGSRSTALEDVPVYLMSRVLETDTLFLCKARNGNGSHVLEYMVDVDHPVFRQLVCRGALMAVCGSIATTGAGMVVSTSAFPTAVFVPPLAATSVAQTYFEIEVELDGLAQIGFCDAEYDSYNEREGKGCGDCSHSWAFDGSRKMLWHNEVSCEWGSKWTKGDVLGVGYTMTGEENTADIYFTLNGKPLGVGFTAIHFSQYLRPCLSFNQTFTCRIEWTKFKFGQGEKETAATHHLFAKDQRPVWESALDVAPALHSSVAALLCALHQATTAGGGMSKVDFCNQTFTSKLLFQLEQTLPVCALALPQWCFAYTREFPFLFPLELRLKLFQLTAFGLDRSVAKLCTLDVEGESQPLVLKRQKIALPRALALESALQLFCHPPQSTTPNAVYTFEFMEEIGHGQGPTLEFYSLISRELCRKDLGMWRSAGELLASPNKPASETANEADYDLFCLGVLFPSLLIDLSEVRKREVLDLFYFLGRFLARALMDERPVDLNLHPLFLSMVLMSDHHAQTTTPLDLLRQVDLEFANNLAALREIDSPEQVRDLSLDNLLPGTQVPIPNFTARNEVQLQDMGQYCDCVATALVDVWEQAQQVRLGLQDSLSSLDRLEMFSPTELREMFTDRNDEAWVGAEIESSMVLREFTRDSVQIHYLLQVLQELGRGDRRLFLRFLTGSSRLPTVGGWKAFKPRFTVVKKTCSVEDLPTCSTCKMELKLPLYTSKQQLREKLLLAIREGQNFFAMD
ncbi:hypothetical protein BASA81_010248 [Batrachochytrium salamandrivorans]|nr:hypothetical protein BASA81_010248 [Batrachochytrium salamandrivorans]